MRLKIGITHTTSHYSNYPIWIKGDESCIEIVKIQQNNFVDLKLCDGIVLSGGIDTHPKFYNNNRIDYPFAPEKFDVVRDEFEVAVFNYTRKKNIPVLAICRGMQLVNIALGGDLIQDIEESGKRDHRRHNDVDGTHEISVSKDSLLYEITGCEKGIVNSAHHQALHRIAPELIVTAFSPDGIAEAIEWRNKKNKAFLLCVQWHPERIGNTHEGNPFSENIRIQFLEAVKKS